MLHRSVIVLSCLVLSLVATTIRAQIGRAHV